jgi:hypothetical protein
VIRRLLLAAAVAVAVSGVMPATPAHALDQCLAGYVCAWYWYADPYHTDLNGYYIDYTACPGGGISRWGLQQGYMVFQPEPCGGPV